MKRKTALLLAATVLIGIVTHFRWFTGFDVLADGDWVMQTKASVAHLFSWPLAWRFDNGGEFNLNVAFSCMMFVQAALQKWGVSYGLVERLEYLWPLAILFPLGSFLLIRKITKSDVAAFVASLAYSYNVYFLIEQRSHLFIMLADAWMPFAALAYVICIRERRVRDIVLAGLALFAVSAADFRLFYALTFVLAGWALFDFVVDRGWRDRKKIPARIAFAALPVIIALLLNAYWLIGFASTGSITSNSILDRGIFGNYLTTTADALALSRGDWSDGAPLFFGTHPVIWRFWWLPLTALAGLWVRRKEKDAVFFGLVALLGIFLGKQSAAPFSNVYPWLFAHFPGFKAFRESSKFFVIIALGYSVLVGFFVEWLQTSSHGIWRKARPVLLGALIILPLWNTVPLLNGSIGAIFKPIYEAPEYSTFNDFLRTRPDFFRVVWVPVDSQWSEKGPTHPALQAINLTTASMTDVLGTVADGPDKIKNVFSQPNAAALLDLLSVRYVGVKLPTADGGNSFTTYQLDRDTVVADLDAAPYLHRTTLGSGDLIIYENADARPHLYATDAPEDPHTPVPFRAAQDTMIDLSRYNLAIPGVHGQFTLHFTDNYHPGWQLFSQQPSRLTALRDIAKKIPGVTHAKGLAGLNDFVIDPALACGTLRCVHEADGSITIYASLFFTPQAWFDLGSELSLTVLLVYLVALAGSLWREKKRKSHNV